MWRLDEMLSPIIKDSVQELKKNEIILMERIRKQKIDLINGIITPAEIEIVRPYIVESWVRCINYGLDPFTFNYGLIMDKADFEQLKREKIFFIKSAEPYIYQLQRMLSDSNYLILLTDENGVILRVDIGNDIFLEQITERFGLMPGTVWTEDTVGTCPHIMSLMLHSPIQLCGPEFYSETNSHIMGLLLASSNNINLDIYSDAISQTSSSSAPIFDVYGNLAGSITIISPYLHYQNSHSLGLVVSTAWSIQNQLQLALNNELLSVTLEAADEAFININKEGFVTKTNMRGRKIFSFLKRDLIGMHIEEILGTQPFIESVLKTGQAVLDIQITIPDGNQQLNLKSAQPVKDSYGTNFGCVLTFTEIQKIKKPVTRVSSFEAGITFNDILGEAIPVVEAIETARKYADLDSNILIQGESGTGKELFAQAIHNASRTKGPFVAINCAAIPITLIESELFGYEAGAFTGAERKGRPGKIELANEGTLFLDEIGDMPLELQPVLLRVLEEKRIMRVGASKYTPVNFRLITASNKDLLELMKSNQFRVDLYYRLAVLKLSIPPLRERDSDIIRLARHFLHKAARQQHLPTPELEDEAIFTLLKYDWPGNVRELENSMIYAINMCKDSEIGRANLPVEIGGLKPGILAENKGLEVRRVNTDELSIKDMEKIMIMQALIKSNYNVCSAADSLGMSRSTLYRKVKSYNILDELRKK